MTRKWSNFNLSGALHFVTGNFLNRQRVFLDPNCCLCFLHALQALDIQWPSRLIAYVLMPDHFHLICNPKDGRIKEFCRDLKSAAAKTIVQTSRLGFHKTDNGHQVWQESFKAMPLWSEWMIWQKIHYVHSNPVKTGLVKTASDYYWSSFGSFYELRDEPLVVDSEWWWPDVLRV